MQGVFTGFAAIAVVISVGALLAHLRVVDAGAQVVLSRIAFFVASPALMVTTLARADVHQVLSANLVASLAAVVAAAGVYVTLARLVWQTMMRDLQPSVPQSAEAAAVGRPEGVAPANAGEGWFACELASSSAIF